MDAAFRRHDEMQVLLMSFRRLLAVLLLLWMPLQGIAAVTMPFCAHALSGHAGAIEAAGAADHGAQRSEHSAHHHSDEPHDGLACNDCGACNLACAPAIPATLYIALDLPPVAFPSNYFVSLRLFDPELPLPPPLA